MILVDPSFWRCPSRSGAISAWCLLSGRPWPFSIFKIGVERKRGESRCESALMDVTDGDRCDRASVDNVRETGYSLKFDVSLTQVMCV